MAHGLKKWDARPLRAAFTPRDLLQSALGRPNREQVVTSRPELFTTLEAMNLANGDHLAEILRMGAVSLMRKYSQPDQLIHHVYAVALTRELKAFTTGGFFGSEYGPMNLPYPEKASQAVQPPKGMSADRFAKRYKALQEALKNSPQGEGMSDYHQESMLRSLDKAHRLLGSKERAAFDLSLEKKESYDVYVFLKSPSLGFDTHRCCNP